MTTPTPEAMATARGLLDPCNHDGPHSMEHGCLTCYEAVGTVAAALHAYAAKAVAEERAKTDSLWRRAWGLLYYDESRALWVLDQRVVEMCSDAKVREAVYAAIPAKGTNTDSVVEPGKETT